MKAVKRNQDRKKKKYGQVSNSSPFPEAVANPSLIQLPTAEVIGNRSKTYPSLTRAFFKQPHEEDRLAEDVLEFLDPTGMLSHDDAKRAINKMRERGASIPNFQEAIDMFGAVPGLGKLSYAAKVIRGIDRRDQLRRLYNMLSEHQKTANTLDFIQDATE